MQRHIIRAAHNASKSRTRIRKTKSKNEQQKLEGVPSLKDFMHRKRVIGQYRGFFRALKQVLDDVEREQLRSEVRHMFRVSALASDPIEIQMALREGERQFAQLSAIVGYRSASSNLRDPSEDDPDSWINIPDTQDPRGRVGVVWPWTQDK